MESPTDLNNAIESHSSGMSKSRSFLLSDLNKICEPRWMIPNVLPERGVTMFYGPPCVGKTFLALDVGLSLAHGRDWVGNTGTCRKAYRVAYLAGEALTGVAKRIHGWLRFHNLGYDCQNFAVFDGVPAIGTKDGRDQLSAWIYNRWNIAPELYIIDTAMCASTGCDLSSPSGSQALFEGCNIIRSRYNASVLLLHHTGKDKSRGPLGAENIRAALDYLERVKQGPEKNGVKTVTLVQEKNKDGELRGELHLALEPVEVPSRTEGNSLTTLVVVPDTSKTEASAHTSCIVSMAIRILEDNPGKVFKVRDLASAIENEERKNKPKKATIPSSDTIRRELSKAAKSGELTKYARRGSRGLTARWLFEAQDKSLDDL